MLDAIGDRLPPYVTATFLDRVGGFMVSAIIVRSDGPAYHFLV